MFQLKQHNVITLLACLCIPLSLFATTSQKNHNQAPYYFVADTVTYLSKTHKLTYQGHVKVDQGLTHITGDHLTLLLTTNNKIIEMVDNGHPATYTTQLVSKPGIIHAKADTITYKAQQQLVYLDGHASVEQNHNTIHAAHIYYDKKNGVIHTRGDHHHQVTHITVMPNVTTKPKAQQAAHKSNGAHINV